MKTDQFPHSTVVAEIQLSYRPLIKPSQRPKVNSSLEVQQVFRDNWDLDRIELQEQFKVMLLNRANRVLGIVEISSGGMTATVADPKLIFAVALASGTSSIILAHNHPSGSLRPSQSDILLTGKIANGGQILDISVLDHIILTAEGYFSFADQCMM